MQIGSHAHAGNQGQLEVVRSMILNLLRVRAPVHDFLNLVASLVENYFCLASAYLSDSQPGC